MKKLMLSTALVALAASAAVAQDAAAAFRTAPEAQEIRASTLIGQRIYASEAAVDADAYAGVQDGWTDIGEVNDVILGRDGTVQAVLLDIGGFLGLGERQVAIDMAALRMVADDATADMPDDYFLVVNADRAMIEAAPEYGMGDAAMGDGAMTDPAAGTGTQAADATDTGGTALDDSADGVIAETTGADLAVDGTADTPMATEEPAADAAADATALREPTARDGYTVATTETLTAERLTGATAYDSNDENIGNVAELLIGADGQITDAVIDVGGFLGIGAKPVAIPLAQIDILVADAGEDLRVYVPMTKEQLEAMPRYEG